MKISDNSVVTIDYRLTDDAGSVLDTSHGRRPLQYTHGRGQLVPGLERALVGHEAGSSLQVSVEPRDGYGDHDESRIIDVPRSELPPDLVPEVGMQLGAEGPDGRHIPLRVVEVNPDGLKLDANHPLAGKNLHFAIDVREVREAGPEEAQGCGHHHEHGHGHHHDHHHGCDHDHDDHEALSEAEVKAKIAETISANRIAVFMKGTPAQPMCGFSAKVVQILESYGQPFEGVNALCQPDFRHILSAESGWPTLPQIFVDGKLVGGADILQELHQNGELGKILVTPAS